MKDLKLNAINRRRLADKHMNSIKGGASESRYCSCSCQTSNGKSNLDTNTTGNYYSGTGGTTVTNPDMWINLPPVEVIDQGKI